MGEIIVGGGASSFFPEEDTPGNTTGWVKIIDAEYVQSTAMDEDKTPLYWDAAKTRPKMYIALKLQAYPPKGDDDGVRMFHASGQKYTALLDATRSNGGRCGTDDGINITYRGKSDREPKVKGHAKAKLYDISFEAGKYKGQVVVQAQGDAAPASRPDSIPEGVWGAMSAATRDAVVKSLGAGPV